MAPLETIIIIVAVVVYALYRQFTTQPVTLRSMLLPVIGSAYLGSRYSGPTDLLSLAVLGAGAVFGLATGAVSGAVVKVWFDKARGLVLRRGGWQFVAMLVGLIAVRFLLRFALQHAGLPVAAVVVTDSFIAMSVAAYLGRIGMVALRALALTGGDTTPLAMGRRDPRLVGSAR